MEVHEQLEKRMMKFNNIEKTLFDQNVDEENLIQQAYKEQEKVIVFKQEDQDE
jgi:hypothetical protein